MFKLCYICLQVSHMLHLSAVSPSYYRFHVEHLQSDDYSKDKVSHNIHLKIVEQPQLWIFLWWWCILIPPHSLGCSSVDWWDGLVWQSKRSRSAASHWAGTSQNGLPGGARINVSPFDFSDTPCSGGEYEAFYGKYLILLNTDCTVDPTVTVCNLAVRNWVQRKWLYCCCDCSQPRYLQGVRWDADKCAFIYWLVIVKKWITKNICLIFADLLKIRDAKVILAIKKKSALLFVVIHCITFVYLLSCWAVILVAHFLQSVSSGLVLGGELVYHRGRAEEGGILTLAGQYSSKHLWMVNTFASLIFFISISLSFPLKDQTG